jgi:hypothetical protein
MTEDQLTTIPSDGLATRANYNLAKSANYWQKGPTKT